MVQQLRTLAVLLEDQGIILNTLIVVPFPGALPLPSDLPRHQTLHVVHIHAHSQNTHRHKIRKNFKLKI